MESVDLQSASAITERQESDSWVEKIDYRGVDINLVAIEHEDKIINNYPEWSRYLPSEWKQMVEQEIKGSSMIFVEYFPADLAYEVLLKNPVVGLFLVPYSAKRLDPFFVAVGQMAEKHNLKIAVADPCSDPLYVLRELAVDQKRWRGVMASLPEEERLSYYGDEAVVKRIEIDTETAVDARRLMTARALMQEAIRLSAGDSNKEGKITYIAPPAHMLRIKNYIERQKNHEVTTGSKPDSPDGMQTICPEEERKKMDNYRKSWGLNKKIRYYSSVGGLLWVRTGANNIY